jgi:hypothetical protein
LVVNAWNYSYQARTEIAPDQGGIEKSEIQAYYLDLTQLFREYGWQRIPSWHVEDYSWTWHFKAFEYWHFQKTDGLRWYNALQEVIAPEKIERFFNYDYMVELGEDPYLIALKGVPLPSEAREWWTDFKP